MAKKSNTSSKEMAALGKDLQLFIEVAQRIAKATNGKTADKLIKALSTAPAATTAKAAPSAPVKKGKRGRPAGSKNAATAKKTGPKTGPKKAAKKTSGGKRRRIGNLSERIIEILTKSNRFMTNSQITDKLVALYPDKDRSYLGKYMSVILSIAKNKKQLSSITKDKKGNKLRSSLWGLPTWFDGNNPKADHLK